MDCIENLESLVGLFESDETSAVDMRVFYPGGQVQHGFACLGNIKAALQAGDNSSLAELSGKFYEVPSANRSLLWLGIVSRGSSCRSENPGCMLR